MLGKISYFSTGIKQTKPTLDITVSEALDQIRSDKHKDRVLELRDAVNKEVRQVLKRDLAYFTFSGVFKARNIEGLLRHSGVICIDLDDLDIVDKANPDLKDPNQIAQVKEALVADPYVMALFVSPSGNGLKILIKLPINEKITKGSKAADYWALQKQYFKAVEKYFLDNYNLVIDPSGKDTSRATYVSYDPDLYENADSKVFETLIADDLEVNYDTGEVVSRSSSLDEMDEKTRKSYERALLVIEQLEEKEMDLTDSYENWQLVGFSMATYGEAGRDLFHRVSQFHPDYRPHDCDRKFDNFIRTTKFTTPAKFFSLAKAAGVEVRKVKKENMGIAEGAKNSKEWQYKTPDGIPATDEIKEQSIKWGFIEHKNRIYMASFDQRNQYVDFDPISNYVVHPLFLIRSKQDPKRLYEIKNMFGEKIVVDIPAKDLATVQTFCQTMEMQGNFLMEPGKRDYFKLKTKWYEQAKDADEIKTLGWHKNGFYAFANGIFYDRKFHPIDEYGVISKKTVDEEGHESENHYFIPAMSDIYKNEETEYENEKSFLYVRREDVNWKEWSRLFCDVHGSNGQVALIYYIACIFRDLIYNRFKNFPHLFGFGPRGTGKSTLGWSLTYMYGKQRKPFNLNSGTAPGFYRTFAQFNNATIWFDEFSQKIDLKRQEDLKNAYDGAGHVKGDWSSGGNSTKTVSTPVKSGCYISGQELPISNPALFSRTILLEFTKSDFTQEEKDMASKLTDMEMPGLSRITAGITHYRELMAEKFVDKYDEVMRRLKKDEQVMERLIHNNAVILATYEVMREVVEFPFSDKEIWQTVTDKLAKHSRLFTKSEETSQFWDMVQYLYSSGQISDSKDFTIKYVSDITLRMDRNNTAKKVFEKPIEVIMISMTRVHPLYQKSLRERGENKGMDKESLIHYLEHSRGYIGSVNKVNYGDWASSGYAFDYATILGMGYNLKKIQPGDGSDMTEVGTRSMPVAPGAKVGTGPDEDLPF